MNLSDNEIKKALECETTEEEKIKAIYPHISASVVDGKPYYCIRWYDIKNKDLNTGYGSFNLEYVCEWYEKYFEEIKYDFVDEINRLQAENERLQKQLNNAENLVAEKTVTITDLLGEIENYKHLDVILHTAIDKLAKDLKAEALNEAASKFAGHSDYHGDTILCKLYCMAEGKEVENAKPLDTRKIKAEAYKEFFDLVHSEFKTISDYQYGKLNMTFCSNFQVAIDKLREIYRKLEGGTNV